MMKPENMKHYNELLWLGVPKKERDAVRGGCSTQYVDPTHVVFLQLTCPPESLESSEVMHYDQYIGGMEGRIRPVPLPAEGMRVKVGTDRLRKILDNVTAEEIEIRVSEDAPIYLRWKCDEDEWQVLIAPILESE